MTKTKIKVKKEGREGVYLVEKEEIKRFIKLEKLKTIHSFIPSSFMMIGADHDIKSVLTDIDNAERIGILTGKAQIGNLGHALSIISNNKLELYDIGKITDKDLIIN